LRVNRRVRQLPFRGLGDAEINDFGYGHSVVQSHQNVRRLDVAVNDALLMRVLDRLADFDKQIETVLR
jgi:hypothetical protein